MFLPYDYGKKGSSGELSTRLVRSCGPDLAHWLCVEMQQNRLKKVAKHKVTPDAGPAWAKAVGCAGGDPQGRQQDVHPTTPVVGREGESAGCDVHEAWAC